MQGVANSKAPVLPVVHLAQVVELGAWIAAGGAAVGLAVMLMIRLLGGSWTFGLLAVAVAPSTWFFGWQAGVGSSAYAIALVGAGLARDRVDLRAGGDLAARARDRIGPDDSDPTLVQVAQAAHR